jgi:predicted transcriptional regulator
VTKEYRERHEIIAHILSTINDRGTEGASRTMIMYNFFLSYAKLKEYLSFLIERGLVDEFSGQRANKIKFVYKVTEKGYCLLQISQEIELKLSLVHIL